MPFQLKSVSNISAKIQWMTMHATSKCESHHDTHAARKCKHLGTDFNRAQSGETEWLHGNSFITLERLEVEVNFKDHLYKTGVLKSNGGDITLMMIAAESKCPPLRDR
jgi:hypothetical protein